MLNFCWHKWGSWSKLVESYGGSLHQVCVCEKCNAIIRRKAIGVMSAQLNVSAVNAAAFASVGDLTKENFK